MAKKTESVVSGAGMFQRLVTTLVEQVKASHGSMEDIHRLTTPEGQKTLGCMAKVIACRTTTVDMPFDMVETFEIDVKPGLFNDVTAGHNFAIIDGDFGPDDHWACIEEQEGTQTISILSFNDEPPSYYKLITVLRYHGYRSATDLELITLGAQHTNAVHNMITGWKDLGTGRLNPTGTFVYNEDEGYDEIVLRDDSRGIHLSRLPMTGEDYVTNCVAVVKV